MEVGSEVFPATVTFSEQFWIKDVCVKRLCDMFPACDSEACSQEGQLCT